MTRGWRKVYTEELHDVYSSPNIIRNYERHVQASKKSEIHTFWSEGLKEKYLLQDLGTRG